MNEPNEFALSKILSDGWISILTHVSTDWVDWIEFTWAFNVLVWTYAEFLMKNISHF